MKYIPKDSSREPESVKQWKRLAANDPNYGYKFLRSDERKDLLKALIEEQGNICCYCGMAIDRENSHVEHLYTQTSHPHLSLEYTNLLASCGISETYRPAYNSELHCQEHCGRKRQHSDLSIKPTDYDCESKFRYTGEGEILPKDDLSVKSLNLNYTELRKLRKAAIEAAKSLLEEDFSNEEIDLFVKSFEKRDHDGKFQPFCFVITYFLKSYI
ncbi:MAG: retron system putative HNH endonuclease [Pseudanabaena sp.]|jgi:uncharacterized protein (TIGR02646 family)